MTPLDILLIVDGLICQDQTQDVLLDVDETLLDALHHFFPVHAPLQVIRED